MHRTKDLVVINRRGSSPLPSTNDKPLNSKELRGFPLPGLQGLQFIAIIKIRHEFAKFGTRLVAIGSRNRSSKATFTVACTTLNFL